MRIKESLQYAATNRAEALLWALRLQRDLLSLAYAKLYYWFFFRLFFGSHIDFIGKAAVRIHPSTDLFMRNSRLVVENGILSIGYVPGRSYSLRDNCRFRLEHSTLRVKGSVQIRPGVSIWAMKAKVVIGNGTVVNGPTVIVSKCQVDVGACCQIARNTTIMDCDMHRHAVAGGKLEDAAKQVTIGNHCWIGHNVTILKGVTVGEGSVVAAHSVVTEDVQSRTIVAGVPAKKIKENIIWEA